MSSICDASFASFNDAIPYIGLTSLHKMKRIEDGNLQLIIPIISADIRGDKIFRSEGDKLYPKYTYCSSNRRIKVITHYTMSQFFIETAPFILQSLHSSYNKIHIKVYLDNMKVGGSVNFWDLGLYSDTDVELLFSLFQGSNRPEEISKIFQLYLMDNLQYAMAREIIEECTPDNQKEYRLNCVIDDLELLKVEPIEKNRVLSINFIFKYSGPQKLHKYREIDIFDMKWNNTIMKAYYIISRHYNGYTVTPPYIHIKENEKMRVYPVEFTRKYRLDMPYDGPIL